MQRSKGANQDVVELASDDEMIQISSDEEDESWFQSKSATPRQTVKLDKGKGKLVEADGAGTGDEEVEDGDYGDGNGGDGDVSGEL